MEGISKRRFRSEIQAVQLLAAGAERLIRTEGIQVFRPMKIYDSHYSKQLKAVKARYFQLFLFIF
jgi:hypothetical protein